MRLRGRNIKTQQKKRGKLYFVLEIRHSTVLLFLQSYNSLPFRVYNFNTPRSGAGFSYNNLYNLFVTVISTFTAYFDSIQRFTGENFVWRNFLASVNSYCGPYQKHTLNTYTSLHSVTSQKPHTRLFLDSFCLLLYER